MMHVLQDGPLHITQMSLVMRKPVLPLVNNKGADQTEHPRCLISAFVVRCLDRIIPLVSILEISSLYLASLAAQVGLCLTWSETPKSMFSRDEAQILLSLTSLYQTLFPLIL